MIAASDPQEYVPSGRQQALRHPSSRKKPPQASVEVPQDILDRFEKVSLTEKDKDDAEWWILRKALSKPIENGWRSSLPTKIQTDSASTSENLKSGNFFSRVPSSTTNKTFKGFLSSNEGAYIEDELYIKGNLAIWTRGLNNCDNLLSGGKTICAYTTHLPIQHANWCTFYCEHPHYDWNLQLDNKQNTPTGTPVPALCIVDTHNIRVFTEKGEDFVSALPFQIEKMWSCKYGILLEKKVESCSSFLYEVRSTLYSLAFPLDEAHPVAVRSDGAIEIFNSCNSKIVFTIEDPSICMIYDFQSRQHSVYYLRKITRIEKLELENKMNSTSPSFASLSNKLRNRLSMWDCLKNSNCLPVPSPINSRPGSVASFHNIHQSRSHSSMATVSRLQSPAISSIESPWLQRLSRLSSSVPNTGNLGQSNFAADTSKYISSTFIQPTLCLELVWTEPFSADDDTTSAASKVFLCDDLIDNNYLCYVSTSKSQLFLVNMDYIGENNFSFGAVNSLKARDAVPIPVLHMLAVLEPNGNVSLYSGLTPVGKLHIGGTLAQHTPSPYVRRNLQQFYSPYPRRSSLLPHCNSQDPKFDEHLLSPVLPESTKGVSFKINNVLQLNFEMEGSLSKAVLNGLRDPIENRFTLRYSDGTYYRITLPPLSASPLVENCLVALRYCLEKETAVIVLTKWYATRNVLGTQDMSLDQEWEMFRNFMFELIGFKVHQKEATDLLGTPSSNPKRQKHSFSGTDEDFKFLLQSNHQLTLSNHILARYGLPWNKKLGLVQPIISLINTHSLLFPQMKLILYCLHLIYEDLKLNTLRHGDLMNLAFFLSKLASTLNLESYLVHYWKDFPDVCSLKSTNIADHEKMHDYSFIEEGPPSIMKFLHNMIQGTKIDKPYRYLTNINIRSKDIIEICGVILQEKKPIDLNNLLEVVDANFTIGPVKAVFSSPTSKTTSCSEQVIYLMTEKKITIRDLDTLPPAVYLIIYASLWKCRTNPPAQLTAEAYNLLWRDDLAAQAVKGKFDYMSDRNAKLQGLISTYSTSDDFLDGMDDIESQLVKLRFPDDVRVTEARKMLQSSKPVPIVLVQRPDVSDHDFIEEQEKHLIAICARTMALSTGRGMFTLRTETPVVTERLRTPKLCLTGKGSPRGTTVELNHIDTPANMQCWPLFHNGVANGLRINRDAQDIDGTWIIFNKYKTSTEQQMEHAGFLMALGLNGHLKQLQVFNTYDYLSKLHEMTSIGLLMGLSAAYRGTCNLDLTKTLSIHVEALLPPTSMELDVHHNVQIAAILGIGFLYQSSSHRHIIEVLLSEIGRPPGPEMENSVDRESYSLAAGLSLGLVTLKQGGCVLGLTDLNISDTLYYYMVGGHRRPLTGAQKDKYKVSSFQIREGTSVNLDVTAPGATIALGLMYFGSGNKAVADWMSPPDTQYLLDFVRPDFLMFRILARALILWDDIKPTQDWIVDQVPVTIKPYCMIKPPPNSDIDYEAMNQAYCNIVTGACFALGLRYAGTADEKAFQTLLHFCHMFTNLTLKPISELAGKPTVETCLNLVLLSTAMVMAGTGNLKVMRFVRLLRRRVGVASSAVVTYGSHLALHMALGLLFLGGGRYTLSNSPASVAALICAFYPKFPTHSNDNRYHLQAFRHLYVLAVEPRLLIPKDVHTGESCYALIKVETMKGEVYHVKGPGTIPDLDTLHKVSVDDERYWPVEFKRGKNWDALKSILATTGLIEVQQRAGCLSYMVDKLGYHSQLAKTLTESKVVPWDPPHSAIQSFTHNLSIKKFCHSFLSPDKIWSPEDKLTQFLTKITYDAVIKDKLIMVPVVSFLMKTVKSMSLCPLSSLSIWQMKLIFAQIISSSLSCNLVSSEIGLSLQQQVVEIFDEWETLLLSSIQCYVNGSDFDLDSIAAQRLALYVIYYDMPFKENLTNCGFLEFLFNYSNKLAPHTMEKMTKIFSVNT